VGDTGLHRWGQAVPRIDPGAFVAPGAQLIGDVTVQAGASVWFNAVLRAEDAPITVGAGTSVQDGCVVHTDPGRPCRVGAGVTVGHGAVLHGCTVEDGAVVGMGATALNGSRVGRGAVLAAGGLLPEGHEVPDGMLAAGVPARVLRPVRPEEAARFRRGVAHYAAKTAAYLAGGPPTEPVPPE
jgi:carbonic anhydrase/acetyltransferase-like protein (isoleucine patch superfamily)